MCVYVCMYVCIYVCIYVCKCIHNLGRIWKRYYIIIIIIIISHRDAGYLQICNWNNWRF